MRLEINNPEDYRAALYIRLSKEDENEGQSESVINQKSLLCEFAEQNSLQVYGIYVDDGWSGTNFERPDFKRMINDIEYGKINMVITKDLSRLGRDYIMTGHYMERYFPEKQVRYISLLDGIDTGVESGANDITPFRAIMNDMYAKDISKKIKSVKRDKQRKGQFIGGKPLYGYKKHPTEKNKIIIDEQAAQIVRKIFFMALNGISCRGIAEKLNNEGIQTPAVYAGLKTGKQSPYSGLWSSERISEMLKNETYLGNMVQGRMVKVSYKSKKCLRQDRKNWIIVENTHEPLVDKDTFERVQKLISSRKHTRSRTYDFLLKGLIFCHECGYPLAVINRPTSSGDDRLFFVCRTYQRFTKAGACSCHSIKEQTVTEAVLEKVVSLCKTYVEFDKLQVAAIQFIKEREEIKHKSNDTMLLKSKLDSLTVNMDKIYMDKLEGVLSDSDFNRVYQRVKAERMMIEEKINALNALIENKESKISIEKRAENFATEFIEQICTNREVLISLIERVELTKEKEIIIKFRFRHPKTII